MKKILFLLYLLACQTLIAQPLAEPIKSQYRQAKTSQQKAEILLDVVRPSMADSLDLAQKIALRNWFKKNGDELGANYCQLYLAATIMFKGATVIAFEHDCSG